MMLNPRRRTHLVAIAAAAAVSFAAPAFAECYDVLGCTNQNLFSRNFGYLAAPEPNGPNCDFLYVMRNGIYKEHGYCFATARGQSEMGNDGCYIRSQAAVPLSAIERANIATIQRAERAKRCPA
jgi:hypothetical protein